jgi:hypothetical protein
LFSFTVEVSRDPVFDRYRTYSLLADGRAVAKVRSAQVIQFDLAAGPHQLQAKLGLFFTSPMLEITGKPGELKTLEVGLGVDFDPDPILSIRRLFQADFRSNYLFLRDAAGAD